MTNPTKPPTRITLRVEAAERAALETRTGDQTLSAYIRDVLFADGASQNLSGQWRKQDRRALAARLLAMLGQSERGRHLADLAAAARIGALDVTPEIEQALGDACAEVAEIKSLLMAALGTQER